MATFDDLKESCEKFVDVLDKIMDNENYDEYECMEHIDAQVQSFKGYLGGISETPEIPEADSDLEDLIEGLDED